jgi:hypothetical protein
MGARMAISNFANEVLADGPIGYWRLGEPLGSVSAGDTSGNANTGTCSGGITFGQPGFQGGDSGVLDRQRLRKAMKEGVRGFGTEKRLVRTYPTDSGFYVPCAFFQDL